MLQNQFQPTLSSVQTPAENQETGVKCRRVVPGSGSSRCQWAAVGIQGMQQLASSGHSQLGSGRGSSCYLGNWALEGVGFLSAVDARGGSVYFPLLIQWWGQLFSFGKLKMLSLRKGAVAWVTIRVCFTRVQKYLKHKLHVNLFPEDHTIDHTIYDVFKSYLWPQSILSRHYCDSIEILLAKLKHRKNLNRKGLTVHKM